MASFFRRSMLRPTALRSAALGLSAITSVAMCEAEAKPAKKMEFVGVFLDAKSRKQLEERFAAVHAKIPDQSTVVLKYNPTADELSTFAPIMGHNVKIEVKALAQDEHTQAAVVAVSTEHGAVQYAVECPHVTLSYSGEEGYSQAYANVLFERLQKTGSLTLEETDEGINVGLGAFEGELTAFDSKLFPFYSPFPATSAKMTVLDEPLVLSGVVCSSTGYDAETESCIATEIKKPECGFCKFMKAGPCGKQFTAWEACLDESKANGEDFLEKCGGVTLLLRDCVDANPEYYSVLNEPPESADDDTDEAFDA
ncbi:hypothetical protein SDRG_05748 [Saprolegnia diclina VS20]|uniref:GCK domain-containing protein n=1 Tax=Saprolegnia diclina (strain VS20) TaxID=1156394 RepID=T0QQA1_SAPDV|nr:hypothetical protein SDRG_05748 [Saprolegnia diclina VS20]EQC36921.1 hypothetical protein SDRG_05748 [Saprolegnia diclina VS20]|eukprot:XP_008609702.1 hypothetical protein SDRG_05748 [Saprolegnia diclina VS20]